MIYFRMEKQIKMWQEHCIKCMNDPRASSSCDHILGLDTLRVASNILEKHFNKLKADTKQSYTDYYEIVRYVRVSKMTEDDFSEIMEGAKFQVAKTMPKNPHSYSLLKTWSNKELWFDVVLFISINASIEVFGGREYEVYYANNGYKYWTMDPTLETTDLINRKDKDADR